MGLNFLAKYKTPLIILFLVLSPLVFYLSNAEDVRNHTLLDRFIMQISSVMQNGIVSSVSGVEELWNNYFALVDVKTQNIVLIDENKVLRRDLVQREEQQQENNRLRRLLMLQDKFVDLKPVASRVIAVSPSRLFRSIRIDRGSLDGVVVGAGVIDHDGVVGRVVATGETWSDVMLLVDVNCSTDIVVQRTRAQARVRGSGRDFRASLNVEYLERTSDVMPGDLLVTNGLGQVFPKGIEVGKVYEVERGTFGLYQTVEIEPAANFSQLETVMVLVPKGLLIDSELSTQEGVDGGMRSSVE